jgi:hypothetical protein
VASVTSTGEQANAGAEIDGECGRFADARDKLRPFVERAEGFSGWMLDVKVRQPGPPAPWDYAARAKALVAGARLR